jgi:acyl-CoA dehydrogenase
MKADKSCCFALTEPNAGSDVSMMQTRAEKKNGRYILNGFKHFSSNAPYADFAIVFAYTDKSKGLRGGVTCFLVDMDLPGITVRIQESMLRDKMQGEITFEDVEVGEENVLGKEGQGFAPAMEWIGLGRLIVAANCVGTTERLLRMSAEYASQRIQFGKPIASRQAIQWMLADMQTELLGARYMLYDAAWRADKGEDIRTRTSLVKAFASEVVGRAADMALQIHGGTGYMREHPIERIYRRARVLRIVEGTSEIQRWMVARALLKGTFDIKDL